MDLFFIPLVWCLILTVWFETNAVGEYIRLLFGWTPIGRLYTEMTRDTDVIFSEWLYTYFNHSFLVRLVTCEVCLTVWFGLLLATGAGPIVGPGLASAGLLLYSLQRLIRNKANKA